MGKMYNTNYGLELARAKIFNALSVRRKIKILDALELSSGDYLPKSKMADGPFVVYGGGGLTQSTHSNYNIDKETIGIGRVGARCGCVFKIKERSWVTDNALYVSLFKKGYDLSFLMHYLNFQNLNQFANQSAQPVISQRGIASCTIPDIDLGEQIIIGRILNAVENQEDFEDAYGLKPLLSFEKDISALQTEIEQQQTYLQLLRQAILQEAVHGRLTPKVETDEPASKLLRRIKEIKRITNGMRTKDYELLPVVAEEMSLQIPKSWAWCRVGEITECLDHIRKPIKKELRGEGEIPYYGANGQVGWIDDYLFDEDLVLVVEDETFEGRTKPFSYIVRGKTWVNNHAHVLRPAGGISVEFLNLLLCKYDFVPLTSGTTGRKKLTKQGLLTAPIAIPPLAEQEVIVAKVGEVMKYIDHLEQQIFKSQIQAQNLLQAVLKETFEGKEKEYIISDQLTIAAEL